MPRADRRRKGTGAARTMDFKKITRNPLFYVLLIGIFLIVGFSLISSLGGAKQISTQEGLELLDGSTVTEVLNTDGDQRVDMKLSEPYEGASDVQFYYVHRAGRRGRRRDQRGRPGGRLQRRRAAPELVRRLPLAHAPAAAARPAVLVPALQRSGRRQQGHAVRQVPGQARLEGDARPSPSTTSPAPTRRSRRCRRSRTS